MEYTELDRYHEARWYGQQAVWEIQTAEKLMKAGHYDIVDNLFRSAISNAIISASNLVGFIGMTEDQIHNLR